MRSCLFWKTPQLGEQPASRVDDSKTSTHAQRVFELVDLAVELAHDRRDLLTLVARGILKALFGEAKVALEALDLLLLRPLEPVEVVAGAIALANHVGEFEVLGLDIALHPLHLVDRLLRRVGLELHLLVLAEHLEVLVPELGVQLGERLVLVPPEVHLVLQLLEHVVLGRELLLDSNADVGELAFERFDALQVKDSLSTKSRAKPADTKRPTHCIVSFEHHLVPLPLAAQSEDLALELGDPALVHAHELLLAELTLEGLLRLSLTLSLQALLLGKLALLAFLLLLCAARLGLTLRDERGLLPLVLLESLALGLDVDAGAGRRGAGRRGLLLLLRRWTPRQVGLVVRVDQRRRLLRELGHVDQTRQVPQVAALVVKLAQRKVLVVVSLLERVEGVHRLCPAVHGAEHADDEAVDTVRLFHLRDERRDAALVVGRTAEVGKDELLERVDVVLEVHQVHDRLEAARE